MDQIRLVRKMKGGNVYPVVALGHTDFPLKKRGIVKQRPHLLPFVKLVALGSSQVGELPSNDTLEIASPAAGGAPVDAEPVNMPTAKEVINDEIKY